MRLAAFSKLLLVPCSFVLVQADTISLGLMNTVITGSREPGSPVEFFGGIPFAEPPVADFRLKPPVLAKNLPEKTLNATKFGFSCLQKGFEIALDAMSEDCLTLNIFRPTGLSKEEKIPVLFWIYGGGFTAGSSSLYNGTSLVTKSIKRGTPIIYASANYRLGPLGFPQGAEASARGALNLGLKDQLIALEWIQENIEAFGGDPKKVTIFGQSAGATSISIHLLGDAISKLARGAIIESSVSAAAFPPEKNEASWQNFVASISGCSSIVNTADTFPCLQNANQTTIMEGFLNSPAGSFGAAIDGLGGVLPDLPSRLKQKARFPLITGSVKDEWTLFTSQTINSTEQIFQSLNNFAPSAAGSDALSKTINRTLQLYPDVPADGSPFGTGNNTFGLSPVYKRSAAIFGDIQVQAPRRLASKQRSADGIKVFSYLFTDPDAIPISVLVSNNPPPAAGSLGVTHTSEIPYVYGNLQNRTDTASALSQIIQDYWISFTVALTPNDGQGGDRPNWREYSPKDQVVLQLDGKHGSKLFQDDFRAEQLSFLSSNPAVFNQ